MDIIAHFDLVKCWNKDSKFFSENEEWYRQEVFKTLKTIKENNLAIEINTAGERYYSCNCFFPSTWILKQMKKLNIPITISSDFHEVGFDYEIEKAIELAKTTGYIYNKHSISPLTF